MLGVDLSLFIGACLVLIIAGNLLVRSLTKLCQFLRINEFVVGFVLMAFSTSLPELSVGISAALIGEPALVLGNVIGSNIVNLTLVAGVTAMLGRNITIKDSLIKRDSYWMLFISTLAIGLMYLGRQLSRIDGIILLAFFAIYLTHLIRTRSKYHTSRYHDHVTRWGGIGYFLIFVVSLPLLFFGANYVVKTGQAISLALAMPPIFIGLFFIALGTSLPELVFSSGAALRKHGDLSLGNLIGSVVFNSAFILGIAAIITPVTGNLLLFLTSSFFMLVICFLFAVFVESKGGLSWKEGFVLLLFYVFFVMVEFSLQGHYLGV